MSENVPFATLYMFYASFPQNEHLANKSYICLFPTQNILKTISVPYFPLYLSYGATGKSTPLPCFFTFLALFTIPCPFLLDKYIFYCELVNSFCVHALGERPDALASSTLANHTWFSTFMLFADVHDES